MRRTSSSEALECRTGATQLTAALFILGAVCVSSGQAIQVGIIDFYGLRSVSQDQARKALTFREGDTVSPEAGEPPFLKETESRLAKVPGVVRARANFVCCDHGRAIVYVGIEEEGAPARNTRAAPSGTMRLPPDIVLAGTEFAKASMSAVQRGDTGEDRTEGHALASDPATRAVQERFVAFAARDLADLRAVLRSSSDASHRALAAQVLGYAPEKQAVVDDLVQAMRDPSDEVRNNAIRALLVFAEAVPAKGGTRLRIPWQPFIELLHSPVWTDRNKASGALLGLSAGRDPALLDMLRKDALVPLVEMARWKSAGHALPAFMILARIGGVADDVAFGLWERGDREAVIHTVIKQP
jgi:hypothetical protein